MGRLKENLLKGLELGSSMIRFVFSHAHSRNSIDSHESLETNKLGKFDRGVEIIRPKSTQ